MILFHRKAAVLYTNRILYNHSRPSAPGCDFAISAHAYTLLTVLVI